MKAARILKIKQINQNPLRQLINIEEFLRFGLPASVFVVAITLTPNLPTQLRILVVGLVAIFSYFAINTEIDRQPAYTLIIPFLKYLISNKKQAVVQEIDFDLVDNMLIFKDKIVAVFKLEPIDLMLLSEQDQNIFIKDIQAFLNSQRGIHTQIIMRNRGAEQNDYLAHFDNIANQEVNLNSVELTKFRDDKLGQYIEDMHKLLDKNIIPIRDFYFLMEQKGDTSNSKSTIEIIESLEMFSNRLCNLLAQAKIESKQVKDVELDLFLKEFIRQV